MGILALGAILTGCSDSFAGTGVPGDPPAAPASFDAWYYAGAVNLYWELGPGWNEDSFRIYGKRITDPDHFLIAEVTNCSVGACTYRDINIVEGVSYNYYVTAVSPVSGLETATDYSIDVEVPNFTPPPVPTALETVALDEALYLRWDANARVDDEFQFYRVYLVTNDGEFLLGETDSEGFLDQLVSNGATFSYVVSAVDTQGHESGTSAVAAGTPRPDYAAEWIYAYQDRPQASGFVFQESDLTSPLVPGDSPNRHFRLEADAFGWWLVPGPSAQVNQQGFATTALKCGPGADFDCVDLKVAPATGYSPAAVGVSPQTSYVVRYSAGGGWRYGVIRIQLLGFDQNDHAIMIFDWAHQLQVDNRNLSKVADH
jgi:hypothetical protein